MYRVLLYMCDLLWENSLKREVNHKEKEIQRPVGCFCPLLPPQEQQMDGTKPELWKNMCQDSHLNVKKQVHSSYLILCGGQKEILV